MLSVPNQKAHLYGKCTVSTHPVLACHSVNALKFCSHVHLARSYVNTQANSIAHHKAGCNHSINNQKQRLFKIAFLQ